MNEIIQHLLDKSDNQLITITNQKKIAQKFSLSLHEIEQIGLENNILPVRYQRHQNIISLKEQLQLLNSHVAIIGLGGIGGYVTEMLTRIGIGHLTICDPDIFEEHNLNRQLFSNINNIGRLKSEITQERILKINPAVNISATSKPFNKENSDDIIEGCNTVVDALDSISTRSVLSKECSYRNIPLVFGAIGGWHGQVAVQQNNNIFDLLYPQNYKTKGVEIKTGNPSFTPAVIAGIQVGEVIKILLDNHSDKKIWFLDLYSSECQLV